MSMLHVSQRTGPPQNPPVLFKLTEHILVSILKPTTWKYSVPPPETIDFPFLFFLLNKDITRKFDSSTRGEQETDKKEKRRFISKTVSVSANDNK